MAAQGPQPPQSSHPPQRTCQSTGTNAQGLQRIWKTRSAAAWALWPVSLVYGALIGLRKWMYRLGVMKTEHPGCPVVVVGNVIAGGAGKTPVVLALVRHLQSRGFSPGVISRGYGRSGRDCRAVWPDSPPSEVGDEPALIARSLTQGPLVPVFVAPQRIAAARALRLAHPGVDVIVCDDGLQHLALQRDLEICVFNDEGIGNGFLLPAGPLREPWPRPVHFVLHAGTSAPEGTPLRCAFPLQRRLAACALTSTGVQVPLAQLKGQPLHAVAAVARPGDFFTMLRAQGLTLDTAEALPDHYDFSSYRRSFDKRQTLICTEKDAVKLWAIQPEALAVPLELDIDPQFFVALDALLPAKRPKHIPPLSSTA